MTASVVALAGGVGGSKLAFGLYAHLTDHLTVVVNTGDDETMYGLRVCPDLDTMRYTLSGMASPATGWGIGGDTFHALEQLERYGLDTWFRLGDRDLATNMARTELLARGKRLTEAEAQLDVRSGLSCRLLPMCDQSVATRITTTSGEQLAFQEYFVHRRHQDQVARVEYAGAEGAVVSPEVCDAIQSASCIILCPSNPIVSVAPILAVPGMRPLLCASSAPRVAVSPIVGGEAVSGPAGQLMAASGYEVSVVGLATLYEEFLTGIVIDVADRAHEAALRDKGLQVLVTDTLMKTPDDKRRLGAEILAWLPA